MGVARGRGFWNLELGSNGRPKGKEAERVYTAMKVFVWTLTILA